MRLPVRWMGLDGCLGGNGFLSSWLEEDDVDVEQSGRRINWGAVAGLALSLVISGGFWAGVGFVASRLMHS